MSVRGPDKPARSPAVRTATLWLLMAVTVSPAFAQHDTQQTSPGFVEATSNNPATEQGSAPPSAEDSISGERWMTEIQLAHRAWIREFSAIRIQWKEWHKATLWFQDQSIHLKTRLEDSPMFSTGELCWKRNAGTTLLETIYNAGRSSNRILLGRDGSMLWLASTTIDGSSLQWDSVQQLPYILDQPIRISRGTVGLRGFWDFALGSFTLRVAGAEFGGIELVDGHECVVVRKASSESTSAEESFWLDRKLGYLPRRYLRIRSSSRTIRVEDWTADEFRELRPGFFLPWHGSVRLNREPWPGYEWQVTDADLKPSFPVSQFTGPIEFERAVAGNSLNSSDTPPPATAFSQGNLYSAVAGIALCVLFIVVLQVFQKKLFRRSS
jgi:hypothetical protein